MAEWFYVLAFQNSEKPDVKLHVQGTECSLRLYKNDINENNDI